MFIDEAGTFSEALPDHILLDNIETIVCRHNQLVSFEASEILKANFANLRCLTLQLMVPKPEDMVKPNSCFENFFSALDGLTELHIYVQGLCMLASGDVKLMELIACNLPNLKDLDISRADDDNPDFQILPHPQCALGNCLSVEKLSGVHIPVQNASDLAELIQQIPCLKHLGLGYGLCLSFTDNNEMPSDEHVSWSTIQSLVIGCNAFGDWDSFSPFMNFIPNLQALDLTCNARDCIHAQIDCETLCVIANSCPKITVLKLPRSYPGLLECFKKLPDLEVLVFPPGKNKTLQAWSAKFVRSIGSQLTKLKSLLGVDYVELDSTPNIVYKSNSSDVNEVLARSSEISVEEPAIKHRRAVSWKLLVPYSQQWHESQGTAYFYPQTSIPNLKFTRSEKESFEDTYSMYGSSDDSENNDRIDNNSDCDQV